MNWLIRYSLETAKRAARLRQGRRLGHEIRSERGQVTVMVGAMVMTFILFFAFVVNTGALVNAKINLQNAADMAAYAGAAVQARQLTNISYLNYDMRRQFKKFLFRYYVLGGMAYSSHPKQPPPPGPRSWTLDSTAAGVPPVNVGAPMVCFSFGAPNSQTPQNRENYCHVDRVNQISMPSGGVQDSLSSVLQNQLQQIEYIRQNNCVAIGKTNLGILYYWLINTDPTLQNLIAGAGGGTQSLQPDDLERLQATASLSRGIGLLPKEFLLAQRIKTLEEYVNTPASSGVNLTLASGLSSKPDAAAYERTIQAFYSAYNTLGNGTFDNEEAITMDELQPNTQSSLVPIQISFNTFAMRMGLAGCNASDFNPPVNGIAKSCQLCPISVPTFNLTVGFYKPQPAAGGAPLTYYAVRLTAQAKTMFNPFGDDLTLEAYSAARPFGSRIGPQLDDPKYWTQPIAQGTTTDQACTALNSLFPNYCVPKVNGQNVVPNLPILANEQDAFNATNGWNSLPVEYEMYTQLALFGQDVQSLETVTYKNLVAAYQAAMMPNPWEIARYNIPVSDLAPITGGNLAAVNAPVNSINNLSDPYSQGFSPTGIMAVWAPIMSKNDPGSSPGSAAATLSAQVEAFFTKINPSGGTANPPPNAFDSLKLPLEAALITYISQTLPGGGGEDGETFNIAHIVDPFNFRPADGDTTGNTRAAIHVKNQGASGIFLADGDFSDPTVAARVKSSWADLRSGSKPGNYASYGRNGYSVKFVPMSKLPNLGSSTEGISDNLQSIQH